MAARTLVDTGAFLGFVDPDDRWHDRCRVAFKEAPVSFITTLAVLTELFHLLGDRRILQQRAWRLLLTAPLEIAPIIEDDLPALDTLMRRYADRPMDFADATLVHVAEREGLRTILTIDHDDFETYRIGRNARFRILPDRKG
jgi:predicted nucleic acid-binding protein